MHTHNNFKISNNSMAHHQIFKKILDEVNMISFEQKAKYNIQKKLNKNNIDEDQKFMLNKEISSLKLNERHYLIIVIEEIVKLVRVNNWDICKSNDSIYLYNGTYWKNLHSQELQKFLGEASEKMGVSIYHAKYFRFRENLLKQFLSSEYLPEPIKSKERVLINLQNGTFEFSENPKLRNFKSEDFLKYQLPFDYDQNAKAPKFKEYLDKVLPEKDKQAVLSEFLGYIFIPQSKLKLEKSLFLYGTGANGKSVLYEIIKALLGSHNTSEYSLQSLTDSSGYYRAMIKDKLVNYASEINGKLDSTKFKALASGESIEARLPYGHPMIIEDYAKLIFNTNELPKDVEFTKAFFRRFIIIPFEVTIPDSEQNKNLHNEIIESELPGVFNWVLEGLKRLLDQKRFTESLSVNQAIDQYMTESDTVKRFIEEAGYEPNYEYKMLLKDLYQEYKVFAVDDGNKYLSKQSFRKRLESLKILINRESGGNQVFVAKRYRFENSY